MEDFTAPSQERLNRTVNAMTDFAARHSDLPQYALIAPNAVNILSDKLPALAAATDQNPYLDATATALEKAGVTFVDVRDTLSQHKDDGIYYHTVHLLRQAPGFHELPGNPFCQKRFPCF